MDTEQARAILRANEVKLRALLNLENAARMSTDDPRSKELLEEAGDAYAEATKALYQADAGASGFLSTDIRPTTTDKAASVDGVFAPGTAVAIREDAGTGGGFVEAEVEGIAKGNVAIRLTEDAVFRGEEFPEGARISVPVDCLAPCATADQAA